MDKYKYFKANIEGWAGTLYIQEDNLELVLSNLVKINLAHAVKAGRFSPPFSSRP